ncbi:hypothetical protein CAP47_08845 [Psychroflexus sp. S27]|uniref:hypothetical protein n=1 Tax=Psychroflexus sp. S27 TaxID=1982757 RepID=UPI000C2A4B56|nr:hypothetical protein [Psychroflexus sp. S27]PJX21725.1 hypothetical protein CAP47_08845 [Psychroflexus sp. S27]
MSTKNTNSLISFQHTNRKAKYKKKTAYKAQMRRVYAAFRERPKTMLQVSKETNVMRANICRYVAKWRKTDKIGIAKYGICPISKSDKVGYYSTDPNLFINIKNL